MNPTLVIKIESRYCLGVLASWKRYINCKMRQITDAKILLNWVLLNAPWALNKPPIAIYFWSAWKIFIFTWLWTKFYVTLNCADGYSYIYFWNLWKILIVAWINTQFCTVSSKQMKIKNFNIFIFKIESNRLNNCVTMCQAFQNYSQFITFPLWFEFHYSYQWNNWATCRAINEQKIFKR